MKLSVLINSYFFLFASGENEFKMQKSFSLFNVVQFKNEACQSVSDTALQGVCYTSQECSDLGGTADGNCANGFGTCCIIIVSGTTGACGGTVTQNCSYIENVDFPSAEAASQTCTYMVTKCSSDICQIRLDFVSTTLGQPSDTTGVCTAGDNLVITPGAGSLVGNEVPTLCGTLTGQHVYLDAGSGTTGATLALTTLATDVADGTKNWRIKVSQIECTNVSRAPPGCLQYMTGVTNIFTSFNWDGTPLNGVTTPGARQLADQNYRLCFRQEQGMCKIQYSESPIDSAATPVADTASGINAFDLGAANSADRGQVQLNADTCGQNNGGYLVINGAEAGLSGQAGTVASGQVDPLDVFCGDNICNAKADANGNSCVIGVPSTVVASAIPFTIQHVQLGNTNANRAGFSLQATQIPCGRSDGN